jgi:hypothetical protein
MRFLVLVAASILATAAAPVAADDDALFGAIRSADMRLATIGYRLAVANATLCDTHQPMTGVQFQTLDQYSPAARDAVKRYFKLAGQIGIEGVVDPSPAATAGLRPDDTISAIAGVSLGDPSASAKATTARLIALDASVAALPEQAPIRFDIVRDGAARSISVAPQAACRTRFELKVGSSFDAEADGTMVQISSRFLDDFGDEAAAVVVAHELAHNILHHRKRLDGADVDSGTFAGFGRNVKFVRQVETQADILSVYLLANAGYDPRSVAAFWRKFGPKQSAGIFMSRSHPDWRDRAATADHIADEIARQPARPIVPAILATRDKPLDGDWQSILVRHKD